jgi:hypothetical protein
MYSGRFVKVWASGLEVRCSIQLSYGRIVIVTDSYTEILSIPTPVFHWLSSVREIVIYLPASGTSTSGFLRLLGRDRKLRLAETWYLHPSAQTKKGAGAPSDSNPMFPIFIKPLLSFCG